MHALSDVICAAGGCRPWFVLFSGGRDSSIVLATATLVARATGRPDPVPVILRFPGAWGTEEDKWQELVLRHLHLRDPLIMTFTDECDLLAPAAVQSLLSHGLSFPPAAHCMAAVYERLDDGVVFTGECGDEIFGAQRVTPIRNLFVERGLAGRAHLVRLYDSLCPAWLDRRRLGRSTRSWLGWLDDDERAAFVSQVVDERHALPFHWARAMQLVQTRHAIAVGVWHRSRIAARHGCTLVDPLWTQPVIAAVGRHCRRWGPRSRTALLEAVFAEVLPLELLRRSTKAHFNNAYFGVHSRTFTESWDGSGIEDMPVCLDALRAEWAKPMPSAASYLLLHHAYLTSIDAPPPERLQHAVS
ncbi:MAG: asparagine synthase-related protein [Acidimicrobiia bacterium]